MSKAGREMTGAEDVLWNLQDLYADTEELEEDLGQTLGEAVRFAELYRGRVADLEAAALADAIRLFERLMDRVGRWSTYAYLNWCTDTLTPEKGALLQKVRETGTEIQKQVLFFELEWIQVPEEQAQAILQSQPIRPFRHYLEVQRLMKDHVLSEAEEKILSEKEITGASAWNRFFDEMLGAVRFRFRNQELTEQEVLSRLYDADREVRREAAQSLTDGLRTRLRELTYIFNVILADKYSDDRLRSFPNWLSSRNLSNEISDEAVRALVDSVVNRYDLVARYYTLKRKLLGLEELEDYDRYAPAAQAQTTFSWSQARDSVLHAYGAFHPRMADIAQLFFRDRWIDAAVRPGKRGGAFSHGAVPSAHPYVLMNYTGSIRDVQTLAHELGHGVHQYLSRVQGLLQSRPPLTMAETASVFGEMLVFSDLIQKEDDPRNRLAMLIGKIDDTTATVFRQITMNRFEDRIHTARRKSGELSAEQFSDLWIETQNQMFQGSVRLTENYRIWWSYIPHFLHTPGYVYAYAFGELLVLALYARYQEQGKEFSEQYLKLLEAGGSDWPHVLIGRLGVDLNDTGFWEQGLSAIEELVRQAEELAQELGY